MDFIKGNEQVKIDPDGINFVGNGNITIDSEKITGDISLNGKVSIINDFDITGKTDFTGDVSMNGTIDISGDISLNGNTDFTGDVSLNGKTNFTGDVSLNGKTDFTGVVAVNGNTDFTGDVSLNGKTDFTGDVSLNGNIEISNNNTFVITNQGYVGIGTSNPEYPLHINKSEYTVFYTGGWATGVYNGSYSSAKVNSWSNNYVAQKIEDACIWLSGSSSWYLVSSDSRIKTDISLISDDTALQQVNQLESYEYHYIDPTRRRPMKTIGFIAQEVNEVLPNAVSIQTEYIPDEIRIIAEPTWTEDASDNWLLDIPDLDMSGAFTGKAKFYVSNDPSGNDEVCKEVEIKEVDGSTPLFTKTKFVAEFDQSWNNVFFYGKEVNDFHTIDKNQIFALHHSAIQELSRRNDKLQEENDIKTNKIASLESRIDAMESAFLAMQALVESTIANA